MVTRLRGRGRAREAGCTCDAVASIPPKPFDFLRS